MSDIHALSGAYAVDALDDIERAQFERHLAELRGLPQRGRLAARGRRRCSPRPPPPRPSAGAARPGARRDRHRPAAAAGRRPPGRRSHRAAGAVVGPGRGRRRAWSRSAPARSSGTQVTDDEPGQPRPTRCCQADDAERFTQTLPGWRRPPPSSAPRTLNEAVLVTEDMPAAPNGARLRAVAPARRRAWCPAGVMPAGRRQHGAAQRRRGQRRRRRHHRRGRRRAARRARGRRGRALRVRGLADELPAHPRRRHRLRGRRPDRGVRRLADRPRHPVRGRRPARRPRGHPSGRCAEGRTSAIDTGFIVHNPRTYPVLLADVRRARRRHPAVGDVDVDPRRRQRPRVGRRARPARVCSRPRPTCATRATCAMLTEIPRFHRRARAHAVGLTVRTRTLREFLADGRFSAYFVRHFMEPLVAAVWSCDPDVALDYPARYLFTFLEHHGMLGIFGSPQWRTVTGGSQAYVAKVAAADPRRPHRHQGHLGPRDAERRRGHRRQRPGVDVRRGRGRDPPGPGPRHARRARRRRQREVLGAMPYTPNAALLHTDAIADAARRQRLGHLELPAPVGRRHRHLRPHPAPAARHRRPTTSSPSAARTSSTPAR